MALKDIFRLDIQRQINGVISAGKDDDSELNVEFSEYVVTNDVAKSLNEFFEYYNEAKPSKNGVWISGFFGSGKSHLLKMLSLVLENKEIDGKRAEQIFLENVEKKAISKATTRSTVAQTQDGANAQVEHRGQTLAAGAICRDRHSACQYSLAGRFWSCGSDNGVSGFCHAVCRQRVLQCARSAQRPHCHRL